MREGVFSKLDSQLWRHVCQAYASVYPIHDRAQFEVNMTADWQPVHHHQVWRDVVANTQLMNKTCCSILDTLQ